VAGLQHLQLFFRAWLIDLVLLNQNFVHS
jgi:hypothetical protein